MSLRQLSIILTRRERLMLAGLIGAALIMAGVELVGIAAVAGFIALVTDQTGAADNGFLGWLRRMLAPAQGFDLVIRAGLLLLAVIVLRNVAATAHTWLKLMVVHDMRRTVAQRLLAAYLAHPYPFFLRTNSAELAKNLTQEVDQFVASYLHGWVTIIADVITAVAIFGIMVWASPSASLAVLALLGMAGGIVWLVSRRRVARLGRINRELNEKRLRAASEAVGAIRDVKLLGREQFFIDRLGSIYKDIRRNTVVFSVITEIPRNLLEIASAAAILLIFVIAFRETASMGSTVAIVSTIVVALYRLLPMLHRILSGAYALRFSAAVREAFADAMREGAARMRERGSSGGSLEFERELRLDRVSHAYQPGAEAALSEVSLTIPRNAVIGLVGPSGSGKTTLAEVMLGLITPDAGKILVDGNEVHAGNVAAWQKLVAYVPQSIYLADDSIQRNIAFGIPDDVVDAGRLAWAVQAAHLDEFVGTLPKGLRTATGERGVLLSGGQRQRIGIARALYRDAKLLVLDEATSALDGITESVIEDAIADLSGKLTVVVIAHRLTSVRNCDVIHLIDGGRVVASGKYADLMRDNATFRSMARAAE